jgi:hypothetical protein
MTRSEAIRRMRMLVRGPEPFHRLLVRSFGNRPSADWDLRALRMALAALEATPRGWQPEVAGALLNDLGDDEP